MVRVCKINTYITHICIKYITQYYYYITQYYYIGNRTIGQVDISNLNDNFTSAMASKL